MDSPSPQPRLRRSPKRKALHERSHSHANESPPPTIRPVTDQNAKVYATSPFPTLEAQRLQPRGRTPARHPRVSSSNVEPATSKVKQSSHTHPINASAPRRHDPVRHHGPIAAILTPDKTNPPSTPAQASGEDPHSPASSVDVDRLAMDRGSQDENHREDYPLQLPSTIHDPQPSQHDLLTTPASSSAPPPRTPLRSRPSLGAVASAVSSLPTQTQDATPMSVSSVGSSGTVRRRASRGPTPPGFYRLFPPAPRPQSESARSARSSSDPPRPLSMEDISPASSGSPNSPVSPVSPTDHDHAFLARRSQEIYSNRSHARSENALVIMEQDVRYPIGEAPYTQRPTSADSDEFDDGSPESSFTAQQRRPVGRNGKNRWTSALSTVQSESTEDRRSSSGNTHNGRGPSIASSAGVDVSRMSDRFPLPESVSSRAFRLSQLPLQGARSGSHIRVVSAEKDLPALPQVADHREPTPPSPVHMGEDNRKSMRASGNRGSGMSFFKESIPAWARTYYSNEARHRQTIGARPVSSLPSLRGEARRHTTIGSPTSPDYRRVAARPRNSDMATFYRDSMAITPLYDTPSYEEQVIRGQPRDWSSNDWSPRLFHNRASAMKRRTIFVAPSINESVEGIKPSRRNLQVWFFVVGFIFPLAWIIASFLPLPANPSTPPPSPGFEHDLEKTLGPLDQARYENARWWRLINRMMAAVGLAVIGGIVTLVVVATKNEM